MATPAHTILTATPMPYRDNIGFFDRDAGLLCLALRGVGINSRFVALGEPEERTDPPLILGRLDQWTDAAWWQGLKADAVVINSWAAPRYEPVARAIKASGTRLVVRLDSDGCKSPRAGFAPFLAAAYSMARDAHRLFPALYALVQTLAFRFMPSAHDRGMVNHLTHAELITIESAPAAECFVQLLRDLGRTDLTGRLRVLPHPVNDGFVHDATVPRRKQILAVGRWDSHQKDGPLLLSVLAAALAVEPEHTAVIVGDTGPVLERSFLTLPASVRSRITLAGRVPNLKLVPHCQASQTLLVTSRYESFHLAAAEALCCGCTVVGPAHIAPLRAFVSRASGTVSPTRDCAGLAAALRSELATWREGRRDAAAISRHWRAEVTASAVATRLRDWLA